MSALASLERFGKKDLVFINWRSCKHCLQNERPLYVVKLQDSDLIWYFWGYDQIESTFWDYPTFTEQKYYNVAIDFAKEALRLQKKEEGVRAMLPAQLESLQKIKKDLIALNNG